MPPFFVAGLSVLLSASASSVEGAQKTEGAWNAVMASVRGITAILTKVKDEGTGKAAIPKLMKAAEKLRKAREAFKASRDEDAALKEKHHAELRDTIEKYAAALIQARKSAPRHAEEMTEILKKTKPGSVPGAP